MKIEGEPSKRFKVFRTVRGEPFEYLGDYDTVEEVEAYPWRGDRLYKIQVDGKKFLTRTEFDAWVREQADRT